MFYHSTVVTRFLLPPYFVPLPVQRRTRDPSVLELSHARFPELTTRDVTIGMFKGGGRRRSSVRREEEDPTTFLSVRETAL